METNIVCNLQCIQHVDMLWKPILPISIEKPLSGCKILLMSLGTSNCEFLSIKGFSYNVPSTGDWIYQLLGNQSIHFLHASFKYALALRIKAGNNISRAHIFSTPSWLKYGDRFNALWISFLFAHDVEQQI